MTLTAISQEEQSASDFKAARDRVTFFWKLMSSELDNVANILKMEQKSVGH